MFTDKLLLTKFSSLPLTARVLAYFIVLLLSCYLALLPRFITGECYIKDSDGGFIPYRGESIHYVIEGRVLKAQITEEGIWSIPVVSKLPEDIELLFICDGKRYPVKITFSKLLLNKNYRVLYDDSNKFHVADQSPTGFSDLKEKVVTWISDIITGNPTYAQDSVNGVQQKEIQERIQRVVTRIFGVATSEFSDNSNFKKSFQVSTIKRIKLVVAIESEFNIKIPDEQWKRVGSMDDLCEFVTARLKEKTGH